MIDNDKMKKLKNHFMYLLQNDADIQSEIMRIIERKSKDSIGDTIGENDDSIQTKYNDLISMYNALDEKYNKLIMDNKLLRKQVTEYENNLGEQERKFENEKIEMKNEIVKCEEQRQQLLRSYQSIEHFYNLYLHFDSSIQKDLERILSPSDEISDTAETFFSFGVQEGNVVALWDVISTNVSSYEEAGCLNDLCEIFNYFLNLHRKVSFKKTEVILAEVGDLYDERYHTRTSGSLATGKIKKVILPGFTIGKNISKKVLVTLEER